MGILQVSSGESFGSRSIVALLLSSVPSGKSGKDILASYTASVGFEESEIADGAPFRRNLARSFVGCDPNNQMTKGEQADFIRTPIDNRMIAPNRETNEYADRKSTIYSQPDTKASPKRTHMAQRAPAP